MNGSHIQKLLLTSLLLMGFTIANAQTDDDDDATSVWATVEAEWVADEKGDRKWPDKLLTEDFSGWATDSPAPRNRASIKMWDRFDENLGKMVAHELYPLSIVVHDDVAVAHYLYTSVRENKDGEFARSNGRYTDVLVRTDDGWKFLAWHGGNDD